MMTPTAGLTPEHIARIVEAARIIAGREPLEVPDDEDAIRGWCVYCAAYDNAGTYNEATEDIDFAIKHAETCPWALLVEAIGPA
ncbi:MAG: hypothetical protein V4515_08260 [Chloroflexota bacterium]